ncbi:ABC transporter permease [Corynebacterium bovis]|uniref:FtsX-like permease family protein n=1 Tax=Corynebacterium bovis TaxID=36808 RepID=UPI00254DC5A7|nr:ABC transporter permease [Corynebacterium bovis]MDK8510331.1 ABC transporter permease [Corynebacterium bovis]
MFVGLRDIRSARGRFILITVTVAMTALLVSFLSGLTGGLAHRNTAVLDRFTGQAVIAGDSIDRSVIPAPEVDRILGTDPIRAGDDAPTALHLGRGSFGDTGVITAAVTGGAAGEVGGRQAPRPAPGHVVVPDGTARVGDTVTVAGREATVSGTTPDDWYSHQQVVWVNWADTDGTATVVSGLDADATVRDASAAADGTAASPAGPALTATTTADLPDTMASYSAEHTTLLLVNVMLMVIAALVTGAFFTVWTIQRLPDIATLKALGASTWSLMRDALGQALIVLVVGVGVGLALTLTAAAFIGDGVPFVATAGTTVLPALALTVLGVLGVTGALGYVGRTSPLAAMGGQR